MKLRNLATTMLIASITAGSLLGSPRDPFLEIRKNMTDRQHIQQSIWVVERYINAVCFTQEYGETVRLKRVMYPNDRNTLTPGYVFTPVNLVKGKKYPGLVILHGSTHGNFGPEFFDLIAQAVTKGYVVIFPEYCGSEGYGAEHYHSVDYAGKDIGEVLSAADYLVKTRTFVDPDRLGIYGFSHGGMLAVGAIQEAPKKFKAAVDVAGVVDLVGFVAVKSPEDQKEIVRMPKFEGKYPYEDLRPYINASPINHVDKIETPLLIITTTSDHHVPNELNGDRLAELLKAKGKTYEHQVYDNAPGGHIFTYGDSDATREAFERTFQFFGKYLQP